MTLPGFTAKSSNSSNYTSHYDQTSLSRYESGNDNEERIVPAAPYWGDFRREGCFYSGRKYSSILWGADGDWEYQCKNTPAYIRNYDGQVGTYYASHCDHQPFNMWGVFFVPESNCPGPEPPA